MKVTIIKGPYTEQNIFRAYDFLVDLYKREYLFQKSNPCSLSSRHNLDYNNPKERRGNDGGNGQTSSS